MTPQEIYTRPAQIRVTSFVAENMKKLLWNGMMDEGVSHFAFNQGALKLLHSRFEFLNGEDQGCGFDVTFQLHELVSFVHFVDVMVEIDNLSKSNDVTHRTKELQRSAVQEVLRNIAPLGLSKAIGAVDQLYLDRDTRRALEEKLQDGGARALNWEYTLNKIQADALRLQFDLLVNVDPNLYPHTQTDPVRIEVK